LRVFNLTFALLDKNVATNRNYVTIFRQPKFGGCGKQLPFGLPDTAPQGLGTP